jgi:hypothetical protein
MNLMKEMPKITARVLKIHRTLRSDMKFKMELLAAAYGAAAVARDFELWCASLAASGDEKPKYPIFDCLKVIDARLGDAPEEIRPNLAAPQVAELASLTYELTNILPETKAVATLLLDYTVEEISAALREYTEGLTEKDVRGEMRKFWSAGGASAVILARRRRANAK